MLELTKQSARVYSRLGQRGAIFGIAALEAASSDKHFMLITADLATLSGMDRYIKTYPKQFLNVGIAEQNMLGIAAGLAAAGYKPVVSTYATFLTMRAAEQIRHYMSYMHLPIVAIGSGAGLVQAFSGSTHYTVEDISVIRAMPNIQIFSPADAGSAVKLFELALLSQEPTYIRLTGGLNCTTIYQEERDFSVGGSVVVNEGADVAVLATGTMVAEALKAAKILKERGLSVRVVDMYSIKPIDREAVINACSCKIIITIEEHNILGGLGSAVAEVMTEKQNAPQLLRLGIKDTFNQVGDYNFLLQQNRLTPELIAEDIFSALNKMHKRYA